MAIDWHWSPITPKGMTARTFLTTIPGRIVCIGRITGVMQLGWSGAMTKLLSRFGRNVGDRNSERPVRCRSPAGRL